MTSSAELDRKDTIGLIGVGSMGRCMLARLTEAGHSVAAYDPSPAARAFIVEHGGILCADPTEVAARSTRILMSLPMPANVLEAVRGMLDTLSPDHILLDTSTVGPGTTHEAAALASGEGAGYVDAPVLGRPTNPGKWLLPAGGSEAHIAAMRPYCRVFAREIIRVGESGAGNVFKLLNQMMFAAINGITSEVMALTDVLNIDRKVFSEVISESGAATVSPLFRETSARMVEDRFADPNFTLELMCKDSMLGLQMAKEAGVVPLISTFIQGISEQAREKGLAKQDTSALVKLFRQYYSKLD